MLPIQPGEHTTSQLKPLAGQQQGFNSLPFCGATAGANVSVMIVLLREEKASNAHG